MSQQKPSSVCLVPSCWTNVTCLDNQQYLSLHHPAGKVFAKPRPGLPVPHWLGRLWSWGVHLGLLLPHPRLLLHPEFAMKQSEQAWWSIPYVFLCTLSPVSTSPLWLSLPLTFCECVLPCCGHSNHFVPPWLPDCSKPDSHQVFPIFQLFPF